MFNGEIIWSGWCVLMRAFKDGEWTDWSHDLPYGRESLNSTEETANKMAGYLKQVEWKEPREIKVVPVTLTVDGL